jgi:ribonuclease D
LIDAAALPDLTSLSQALRGAEWVLHAASQDLPSLRACGIEPDRIFDTELASRLLGLKQVGLAAVVARTLGLALAKEHSAQNWSRRPLPEAWLNYAALDVAVLLDVRDVLEAELQEAGKLDIARAEADNVLHASPPTPRPDPWRRTTGAHTLKDSRRLAVLRSMWQARDRLAAKRDVFPGRVLPDAALVAAASAMPSSSADLRAIAPFNGRNQSRLLSYWWAALAEGLATPRADLPPLRGPVTHLVPAVRQWQRCNPAAAERMTQVKAALAALSETWDIPVENLARPDLVRQVVFQAPADIPAVLAANGARDWQIKAVGPILEAALADQPSEFDVPPSGVPGGGLDEMHGGPSDEVSSASSGAVPEEGADGIPGGVPSKEPDA